jgi:hypothetical protein
MILATATVAEIEAIHQRTIARAAVEEYGT